MKLKEFLSEMHLSCNRLNIAVPVQMGDSCVYKGVLQIKGWQQKDDDKKLKEWLDFEVNWISSTYNNQIIIYLRKRKGVK